MAIDFMCNTYVEVDTTQIQQNIANIRNHIGENMEIIAVLKGNAYGMGLTEIGKFVTEHCGIKTIACAHTFEAVQLIEAGVKSKYFVMGGVPYNNIKDVVSNNIETSAFSKKYLELLNAEAKAQSKKANVHIKIETGLNRIGVLIGEDLDNLCNLLKSLKNLNVNGIYTHFADAENTDKTYTHDQFDKFKKALVQVKQYNFNFEYVHAFNTAGASLMKDDEMTHIRVAGLLFGFDTNPNPEVRIDLKEVLSWKCFVTNLKTIGVGESVGYSRYFKAERPTKVATISSGYGDGYNRVLGMTGAEMIVNGKRAKLIGICMDQAFLDVTDMDDIKINDTVTMMGHDGDEYISVFELGDIMEQTYLATIATISSRVKRVYR